MEEKGRRKQVNVGRSKVISIALARGGGVLGLQVDVQGGHHDEG